MVAHNERAKSAGKYVLCTKKPSFLAKLITFQDIGELDEYVSTTESINEKLKYKNAILEVQMIFCSENQEDTEKIKKLLHQMVIWFQNYGEKEASGRRF